MYHLSANEQQAFTAVHHFFCKNSVDVNLKSVRLSFGHLTQRIKCQKQRLEEERGQKRAEGYRRAAGTATDKKDGAL